MYRFAKQNIIHQTVSSLILLIGLSAYIAVNEITIKVNEDQAQFDNMMRDLRDTRKAVTTYETQLASLPWPENTPLRQEKITYNGTFGNDELRHFEKLLQQTHGVQGIFELEKFEFNAYKNQRTLHESVQLRLKGNKTIIGDKP